mmetsp:Transcript_31123/g.45318  ORF Transcript_31123/g.45318 Transcript_31123/m.45318 type:complete len:104 (-) Transcript_31123:150-461(-)
MMVGEAKKALQKDLEKEKSSREGADKSSLRQEMLDSIVPWAINRHDSKEEVIPHAIFDPQICQWIHPVHTTGQWLDILYFYMYCWYLWTVLVVQRAFFLLLMF